MYEVVIPVGAENADSAVAQATAVSDLPEAPGNVRATVMHAFTDNPSGASITQIGPARKVHETLEDAGIEVEYDERSGDPVEAILDVATEHDADLICIGGRKRTPTGKALFGSVTQSVLLETDRPVMVCNPESSG